MFATDSLQRLSINWPETTIVHVGAGNGAVLDRYARLAPSRVVLVEGDSATATVLRRAARPFVWARVIADAVAADEGDLTWNRYNLPMLNGPVAADPLVERYPRLHREGVDSVSAISLSVLLRTMIEGQDKTESTVLLLDVPGQEGALLHSIRGELDRLTAIIVRRCAVPLAGAMPWATLQAQMHAWSFEPVGNESERESTWPVALFRFDRQRHQTQVLRGQIETLNRRLEARLHEPERATASRARADSTHCPRKPRDPKSTDVADRSGTGTSASGKARLVFDPLDQLIASLDTDRSLDSDGSMDARLLANLERCLIEMTGEPAQPTLVIDRLETTTGPLNLLHAKDDYIPTRVAREGRYYELQFLQALGHFHQPESLVVDIGANIGNHSVYFAKALGASVAAFEPEPHNILCLEVNARLNGVQDQVNIHRFALGAATGEVTLAMSINLNYGSFSAVASKNSPTVCKDKDKDKDKGESGAGLVPVRRLDQVLDAQHPDHAVSLMKIDVEGMELDVLRGSVRTIQRWMPAIACECVDKAAFRQIDAFLSRFGYSVVALFNSTPTFLFCNTRVEWQRVGLSDYLRSQVGASADSRKGFLGD